jgi:hypothetical protein
MNNVLIRKAKKDVKSLEMEIADEVLNLVEEKEIEPSLPKLLKAKPEKKKKLEKEIQEPKAEFNPFENPEAALNKGSDEHIELLVGNDIELPAMSDLADDSDDLRDEIRNLANVISSSYWGLAEKLSAVFDQKRYKNWGYPTFDAYADQELNIKRTKAYDLANTYRYFTVALREKIQDKATYEAVLSEAKNLEWTKALKLATEKVIDHDNAQLLISSAKTKSLKELETQCKEIIDAMPEEKAEERKDELEKISKKTFGLTLWQTDVVENTIDRIKKEMKAGASDSSALVFLNLRVMFPSIFQRSKGC